jgi:hypothetical protein
MGVDRRSVSSLVPEANAQAISRRFPDGAAFLAGVPARLDEVARRWRLTLGEPLRLASADTSSAYERPTPATPC